jgi:hypothetical protein
MNVENYCLQPVCRLRGYFGGEYIILEDQIKYRLEKYNSPTFCRPFKKKMLLRRLISTEGMVITMKPHTYVNT